MDYLTHDRGNSTTMAGEALLTVHRMRITYTLIIVTWEEENWLNDVQCWKEFLFVFREGSLFVSIII